VVVGVVQGRLAYEEGKGQGYGGKGKGMGLSPKTVT
jgi:hypothetical protein